VGEIPINLLDRFAEPGRQCDEPSLEPRQITGRKLHLDFVHFGSALRTPRADHEILVAP
jgi:hypothetical protein